jgi:hypothetical protein
MREHVRCYQHYHNAIQDPEVMHGNSFTTNSQTLLRFFFKLYDNNMASVQKNISILRTTSNQLLQLDM